MSNAPQGGGGGSAEGGHVVGFGGFDGATPVLNIDLGNAPLDNRVQNINVTSVANDQPNDNDYDDQYPGGPAPSLGNPLDG